MVVAIPGICKLTKFINTLTSKMLVSFEFLTSKRVITSLLLLIHTALIASSQVCRGTRNNDPSIRAPGMRQALGVSGAGDVSALVSALIITCREEL
jgi:hypothetical protein